MRQIKLVALFVFSFCLVLPAQERKIVYQEILTSQGPIQQAYLANQIIVKPKAGYVSLSRKHSPRAEMVSAPCDALGYCYVPYTGTPDMLVRTVSDLRSTQDFGFVSLSPVLQIRQAPAAPPTNDPALLRQWALVGNLPASIGWTPTQNPPNNLYAMYPDTGACFGHEDLDWSKNWWNYNAYDPSGVVQPYDDNGHSCAAAGLVSAKANNGKGIAGIADFANFAFIKVCDAEGQCDTQHVVNGFLAMADQASKLPKGSRVVANMSFGSLQQIPAIDQAISICQAAGIIVVAAAGNDGLDVGRFPSTPDSTPDVIVVGAVDTQNKMVRTGTWASNYGSPVTAAAPGVELWTTVPKTQESSHYTLTDPLGYKLVEGSSFSSPIVLGAILQLLAKHPDMSAETIRIRVMNGNYDGSRPVPSETIWNQTVDAQRLFASAASIYLPFILQDQESSPAQPTLEVSAGHSSAVVKFHGAAKPFGARCFYGDISNRQILERIPLFTDSVILRGQDGTPLVTDADYQASCQTVDSSGNWSKGSPAVSFHTGKSQKLLLDPATYTADYGPLKDIILSKDPNSQVLWSWKFFPLLNRSAWYAGTDLLNYSYWLNGTAVGNNDSALITDWLVLPTGSVSINLQKFVQMIGKADQGFHYDDSEVSVVWQDNAGNSHEKVLTQILPNNIDFGMETWQYDVSEFSGMTVKLKFRFFTNGSSVGIGEILGDVTIESADWVPIT